MYYVKKISLSICIILLIMSLYNDFKKESVKIEKNDPVVTHVDSGRDFSVVKIKTMPGDTVLSIAEKLNGEKLQEIKIEDIMNDFAALNPEMASFQLKPHTNYLFPNYKY